MDTKFVVAFSIVIGLLVGSFLLRNAGKTAGNSAFTPNFQNDKKIAVSGLTHSEVSQVVADFRTVYADSIHKAFSVLVSPQSDEVMLITLPNDIDSLHFHFLINYLQYPGELDVTGRHITVIGSATLGSEFNLPDSTIAGRRALFYIPREDQQYDEVYVQVGQDVIYVNSFARDRWKVVSDARMSESVESLKALLA